MNHPESDNSVERLVKLAGEPDLPSAEGMRRARAASEQAWRQMLAQSVPAAPRRGRFLAWGFALAASVALVAWMVGRPAPELAPVVVARVLAVSGASTARLASAPITLAANAPLSSGTILQTADGRVAMTFGGTLSLRVDRDTRLSFDAVDQVTLLAGSLYVDSGGINAHSPLRIRTPAGEVSHIGTQFQVFVSDQLTRVRVREGRVLIESRDARRQDLATGDALEVRGHEFVLQQGLTSFGADWAWAAALAPVLEIENRPLSEFLAWLVREQGWRLHYSSERLQEQAGQIRLHGSLEGLDAAAMLERVSMVTGVPLEVRQGVLWVGA
jgi:ferric-dicitrate binding protein FerR (iron transport regulator)